KAPRISELFHGRIEKFSLDLLVSYLARLGKRVDFKIIKDAA
ncbi:MAG TPA: transcriptional regulator, partial [Deltaproteobacteria bacterium]|nr:transcriptional regulator [Deltaproteobacteria bacterium]